MDRLRIKGGNRLTGTIHISGAKNAVLKHMCATLLTAEPVTLSNVPDLDDVRTLAHLLGEMGTKITLDGDAAAKQGGFGQVITFHTPEITNPHADYELVRRMRASFTTLGPLVARHGYAEVSLPGGCAIGTRPVEQHIMVMETLGAEVLIDNGYVIAKALDGLKGAEITFPFVTVGGTECAMLAATLAKGETVIHNAAREPEISDIAELLNKMGAKVSGHGTSTIRITGVEKLHGASHETVADRIETGSFAIAAAITGGDVLLKNARLEHLSAFADKLIEAGVTIEKQAGGLRVSRDVNTPVKAVNAETAPFPGLATDLQSPLMALLCIASGDSVISETIYENRFMHVPELARMGAKITVDGNVATIHGGTKLKGAPVMATDLRASIALVLAALVAQGETIVSRIYHLDRGYERLEEKLRNVGAEIERIGDENDEKVTAE